MLVLSRKRNERIRVGKDVWITVTEIRPGAVRIGVTAPRTLEIVRAELDGSQERKPATDGQS